MVTTGPRASTCPFAGRLASTGHATINDGRRSSRADLWHRFWCIFRDRFGLPAFGAVNSRRHPSNEGDPRFFGPSVEFRSARCGQRPVEILPTPTRRRPTDSRRRFDREIGDGSGLGAQPGVWRRFRDFVAFEAPLNESARSRCQRGLPPHSHKRSVSRDSPIISTLRRFGFSRGASRHPRQSCFYDGLVSPRQDTRARPAVSAQPAQLPRIGHRAGPVQRQVTR